MSENKQLIHISPILFTGRALDKAREANVTSIVPNRDHMLAINQAAGADPELVPDLTILRDYHMINWDTRFQEAAVDFPYYPASELAVTERPLQTISAGGLRQHTEATGKKLLELTVRDWRGFGELYAEAIENSLSPSQQNLISTPLAWLSRKLMDQPEIASPRERRIAQARTLAPYVVSFANR